MAQLKQQTVLTLTHDDIASILTEEVCKGYNVLSDLQVTLVELNAGGGFDLILTPITQPEEAA